MSSRIWVCLGLTLLLAFAATPALAGGWAVITLDELPTNVVAGEPLEIGFMVRQHGVTPMSGIYPTVTARSSGGEEFSVPAQSEGETGHYAATLTFPAEGSWAWSIQAFTMDQPLPDLVVSAPGTAASSEPAPSLPASLSPLWVVRGLLLGIALVGLAAAFQRKSRPTAIASALCLLLVVGTFLFSRPTARVEAQGKSVPETSQVETGRQLFLAKGCITCHYNDRAAARGDQYWTIEMGAPDLTNYSSHRDVLFIRLKDPAAAKSDSKMPDLGLKETEIEALIAFINSK